MALPDNDHRVHGGDYYTDPETRVDAEQRAREIADELRVHPGVHTVRAIGAELEATVTTDEAKQTVYTEAEQADVVASVQFE